ncbi:acyltransferase [Acerihabitans sp. TG2]|uniref:acyltransferase n=1 Tax=Acerihabitans sp. TG2 TaxID=3096008 RepID=UPI002B23061D|nr:acyltransferase [Acerihabitans sp. TG2]MEA9389949.1 acyltransferase [Acerihabitans sp. TG2]
MDIRIHWIDNLRGLACMMVIMIHTTTFYVTHGLAVGEYNWLLANVLNSASRVAVPLFFMISGFLFFGDRPASKRHLLRVGLCLLFYSLVALLYMALLTPMSATSALDSVLQKPVFYHLWFFYAVIVIYFLSPLIQIRAVSAGYIAVTILLLAVLANPNTVTLHWGNVMLLPINLFIGGDTFYYVLYAAFGRAIGLLTFQGRKIPVIAAAVFIISVALVAIGTKKQLIINGDFADTYYLYCGPLVFVGAVALFVFFKQACCHRSYPCLRLISRYSLAIYGFHAFIIHFIRTHDLDEKAYPAMDILYIFVVTLALSLLLAMGLRKIDHRRWVS